jgi:hypothetical protein
MRFSITELVIDFVAPDGRAENLRMNRGAEWANAYAAPDRYLDNLTTSPGSSFEARGGQTPVGD